MADITGVIQWLGDASGALLYAVLQHPDGRYYNTSTHAFEALDLAHLADYAIALTESPANSCWYVGDWPEQLPAAYYQLAIRERIGAAPAATDPVLAWQPRWFTGSTLLPSGGQPQLPGLV